MEKEKSFAVEETKKVRKGVVEDLKNEVAIEEISWRQKSREL